MKKLFPIAGIFLSLVMMYSCKDDGVDLDIPKPFTQDQVSHILSGHTLKKWQRIRREENGQEVNLSDDELGVLLTLADTAVAENEKNFIFQLPDGLENDLLTISSDTLDGVWSIKESASPFETANELTLRFLDHKDLEITYTIEEITLQHVIITFPSFEVDPVEKSLLINKEIRVKEEYLIQ